MDIHVDCYAGYKGEQQPRRFRLRSRTIEINTILDQWLAPDHRYFKVQGDDHAVYILRHDPIAWKWELTFYQRSS
jgi:hypothetical protein